MIRIGASGANYKDRVTLDCRVVETRQYPFRDSDCWGVAQKAIDNDIYLIFNICVEGGYNPSDYEWIVRVKDVVNKLISLGANKNNTRITLINEPMKYITKERYAHLIRLAYYEICGKFLVGAGNEEFLLARAKGDMYQYILKNAPFDVLDIHIQGSCLKEVDCSNWTNLALNLAVTYGKILDCTEANYSNVAKDSGYKTLLMQLKYAEKIRCENFPVVFIGLSNESKYEWLSFIYNGRVRSPYWNDFKNLMKLKAPIPNIPEVFIMYGIEINYVKPGSKNEETRAIQQIMIDEGYDLSPYGIDGIYGDVTKKAILEWQEDNDLKIDGWVGKKTWEWLFENTKTGMLRFMQMIARTGRYK